MGTYDQLIAQARRHYATGDAEAAVALCSMAIIAAPMMASAWSFRGRAREAAGDPEGAMADSVVALGLNPSDAVAWRARSSALLALGDPLGAAAAASEAANLDPTNAHAYDVHSVRGRSVATSLQLVGQKGVSCHDISAAGSNSRPMCGPDPSLGRRPRSRI